jgi:hypothetical protein
MDRRPVAPQHGLASAVEIDGGRRHSVTLFATTSPTSSFASGADNFWIVTNPWARTPIVEAAMTPNPTAPANSPVETRAIRFLPFGL